MNIKNITVGQSFTAAFTFGTVYKVERVSSADGLTAVSYVVPESGMRGSFAKPSLISIVLV